MSWATRTTAAPNLDRPERDVLRDAAGDARARYRCRADPRPVGAQVHLSGFDPGRRSAVLPTARWTPATSSCFKSKGQPPDTSARCGPSTSAAPNCGRRVPAVQGGGAHPTATATSRAATARVVDPRQHQPAAAALLQPRAQSGRERSRPSTGCKLGRRLRWPLLRRPWVEEQGRRAARAQPWRRAACSGAAAATRRSALAARPQ